MLKIEFVPNRPAVVEAGGSLKDIVAEFGVVVGSVHNALKQSDPAAAAAFKGAMQHVMVNEAPTWGDGIVAGGISIVMPRE